MKQFKIWALVASLMVIILGSQAHAQVSWNDVVKKAKSGESYHVTYRFFGERGEFDFDYTYGKNGDGIRTEVLRSNTDPSKRGTVIIFDKNFASNKVVAHLGGGTIVRNTSHNEVVDTPFYRSLFGMIIGQVSGKPSVATSGGNTVFTFNSSNGPYKIWVNSKADIVKTERRVGNVIEKRYINNHDWGKNFKVSK